MKKILRPLFLLLMLISLVTSSAAAMEGDADGNQIVNEADLVTMINNVIAGTSLPNFQNADLNRNTVIDLEDLSRVVDIILKLVPPPEPDDGSSKLVGPQLPILMYYQDIFNPAIQSTLKLTEVRYDFLKQSDGKVGIRIYFNGEKIQDTAGPQQSSQYWIGWQIMKDGEIFNPGYKVLTPHLRIGDTFSNVTAFLNFLEPGTYELILPDASK